jgi:hypothetical protein
MTAYFFFIYRFASGNRKLVDIKLSPYFVLKKFVRVEKIFCLAFVNKFIEICSLSEFVIKQEVCTIWSRV